MNPDPPQDFGEQRPRHRDRDHLNVMYRTGATILAPPNEAAKKILPRYAASGSAQCVGPPQIMVRHNVRCLAGSRSFVVAECMTAALSQTTMSPARHL